MKAARRRRLTGQARAVDDLLSMRAAGRVHSVRCLPQRIASEPCHVPTLHP